MTTNILIIGYASCIAMLFPSSKDGMMFVLRPYNIRSNYLHYSTTSHNDHAFKGGTIS